VKRLAGNAEQFAEQFNSLFPGAFRILTADDVKEIVRCGLIRRHGYYEWLDLQTVRGIIQYEALRNQRLSKEAACVLNMSNPVEAGVKYKSDCHVER